MIVTCPCPNSKKFEVDDSLIPKKGRLVQCGFCGHKWQFNIEQNRIEINKNEAIFSTELNSNNNEIENDINNIEVNSEKENIEEIDETLETDDQIIPEIDEDTIPDLENSSDDEIIDSEPEADINEFDADDLDDLNNEDDDFIDEDDDVSDVIKNVQNDNAQE